MQKSDQLSISSDEQVHVHYHYYYPFAMRMPKNKYKTKKSVSFDYEGEYMTPREKGNRQKTMGNQIRSLTENKKMRMSDLGKSDQKPVQNMSLQQHNLMARAKSVVEEQLPNFQEDPQNELKASYMRQSVKTGFGSESNQSIIAYYQGELSKHKKQIDRLKMIEEECIYLRDKFYTHYTERCPLK